MMILRISTRIFPDIGGPAKQAFILSKACSIRKIHTFNIACIPRNKKYVKQEIINSNFEIHYLPFHAPGNNSGYLRQIIFFLRFFFYGLIKSIKIMRNYNIDIIHVHSPPPSDFIAFLISKIFRIPYFYSIHGLDYPSSLLLYFDIIFFARNSKKTISVSKTIENFIKNRFKLKNVCWIPNGIETSNYYHISSENEKNTIIQKLNFNSFLDKGDFIISYIGYMIFQQKVRGMIDFLMAFSEFLKHIKPVEEKEKIKLLYIGDGKYISLLKEKAKELDLNQNVFLLGYRNDVEDILAISDLCALTSYVEGFPNVLLEAMASSVPCLATDVGEVKSIVKNAGFLVEPGNIDNIRKNLELYFKLPEVKLLELIDESYKRIKDNFDIKIICNKLIKIYVH